MSRIHILRWVWQVVLEKHCGSYQNCSLGTNFLPFLYNEVSRKKRQPSIWNMLLLTYSFSLSSFVNFPVSKEIFWNKGLCLHFPLFSPGFTSKNFLCLRCWPTNSNKSNSLIAPTMKKMSFLPITFLILNIYLWQKGLLSREKACFFYQSRQPVEPDP